MRSSTSNFKWAIITASILLAAYTFCLRFIPFALETGPGQAQENKIKLENFVFENSTCDKFIVGSSLAYRLRIEDLDNSYCNLALAGSSAITGLEVLKHHLPPTLKSIFIEINVLRTADKDLLDSVQGVSYWLKKYLLFFQTRYQPITVGINYLRSKVPYIPPVATESQFNTWLTAQQSDYSDLSEAYIKTFETNLGQLKSQIQALEAQNIQVHLMELPMDPSLLNSKKNQYQRLRFSQTFPDRKTISDETPYQTDDGLHLNYTSASKFAAFIKSIAH